jgi:pimeloyl-ACP methyl ester carboxylesterase
MQDNTLELSDGRTLGFSDYGRPDAVPVMLFHGTPGSRVYGLDGDHMLGEFGVRVVCPERPGYGLSDLAPGRAIHEWAADVKELADHLGLGRFHVAGESGGGPYALACAIQMPDRVSSATLIGSACPPEALRLTKDMALGNRLGFFFARHAPLVTKILSASFARAVEKHPDKVMDGLMSQLCEWDRRTVEEGGDRTRDMLVLHFEEAFRQGAGGHYTDTLLVSRPWGLDFRKTTIPVFMWHGESDALVPIGPARAFARMIPGCESHLLAGAGHLLLESEQLKREIVARLLTVRG